MKSEQSIQEYQYEYPYHYIPALSDGYFSQHLHWSWGFRYLGGMKVVKDICAERKFNSLLDIGCGDGRFINEMVKERPEVEYLGIDYSEKAIRFARAFNPSVNFQAKNIIADPNDSDQFDVVTLIEVIEHIPPENLELFLEQAIKYIKPNGRIVLTVPHKNKPLNEKHFQHFSRDMLFDLFSKNFEDIRFEFFDPPSKVISLIFRLLGGCGGKFIITWPPALRLFYKIYTNRFLYSKSEKKCGRIALVGKKL